MQRVHIRVGGHKTHCTTWRRNSKDGTFYGCATASQPARRTQLQLRHRYILTAANRAVAGTSPKCCILSPQSSHFRSVSVWGVATAVMIHRAPFKSEIQD